jgi:hypothetical protein
MWVPVSGQAQKTDVSSLLQTVYLTQKEHPLIQAWLVEPQKELAAAESRMLLACSMEHPLQVRPLQQAET